MSSTFPTPAGDEALARATANLTLVIDRGGCFQELPIDVIAGTVRGAPFAQLSGDVVIIHPQPETQACRDFLVNALQREMQRTGNVAWVIWRRYGPALCTRVEADAIFPEAPLPAIIARHDAGINALFEKHRR